uniref:Chromosome 19 open reading frame 18 n=1 Tax=Neovison vison TaxID=452646 RepID=A0A8C7B4D5_NEOVI
MDKVQSSFTFLVLFLMECPLLLCLPYGGEFQPVDLATDLMGYKQSQTSTNVTKQEGVFSRLRGKSLYYSLALISHRPALVQVIIIACVAFTIALVCGIAISYVIYRLVHAEERQQLVWLYNNVSVPFLGGDNDNVGEDSESESLDESAYLLPENEEELEKFIHSVIRSKRRKHVENKRLRKEQNLLKGTKMGNSMPGIFSEDL